MSEEFDGRNDWLRKRSVGARVFFSVSLIGAGVLLFLANLGLFAVRDVWLFWPLFPIAIGLGKFSGHASTSSRVWGFFLVLFGSLFLSTNFGWIHIRTRDGSWPISLLLIAAGFAALVGVLDQSRRSTVVSDVAAPTQPAGDYENTITDFAVFGSLKRKLMSTDFQGGDLTSVFGNVEVDLRQTWIAEAAKLATVNVNVVFGAIKIRVPATWRVHVSGAGIFGNFEDKTILPNIGPAAPTLIVTGFSIFGAVEIED